MINVLCKSWHIFILLKDEEKQAKRKFQRFDREKGHLDGDGLWYEEHPAEGADDDSSDDEEDEKEDLGLNEEEDSEDEDNVDDHVITEVKI